MLHDLIQQRFLVHLMCLAWKDRGVGWKVWVRKGLRPFECPCGSGSTWNVSPLVATWQRQKSAGGSRTSILIYLTSTYSHKA